MNRDEIQELLPFLANDTLTADERAEVEAQLDAELTAELEALRAIRETMRAEELEYSPGEMGLARLMREVEAEAQPNVETSSSVISRPWLWQSVAAVLLAVLVGQTAFQLGKDGGEPGDFTLASGEEPATAAAAVAHLSVAFAPDTTEQDLRNLLLEAGVEIVSGPTELGVYMLSVADGASLDEAIAILTEAPQVESLDTAE